MGWLQGPKLFAVLAAVVGVGLGFLVPGIGDAGQAVLSTFTETDTDGAVGVMSVPTPEATPTPEPTPSPTPAPTRAPTATRQPPRQTEPPGVVIIGGHTPRPTHHDDDVEEGNTHTENETNTDDHHEEENEGHSEGEEGY